MVHKKVFWMNVILAVPFALLTFYIIHMQALDELVNTVIQPSVMAYEWLYLFTLAPLVFISSAYVLKTNKKVALAKLLNILQLTLIVLLSIYVFTEPTTMSKKIMRMELIVYLIVFVIPSIINLRALAKIGK